MYINTSGKLIDHPSNISTHTDNKNYNCYRNGSSTTDVSKNIVTSDGPLNLSPTSVSPTRIFPDTDFTFNHNPSFFSSNINRNGLQSSPSENVPFYNNNINKSNKTLSNTNPTSSAITKDACSTSNTMFHNNNNSNNDSISSFGFIHRPKRINEFNQRAKDDDLIKVNTERNRYIPSRSKSLPFNSLKLKSNLKSSNGQRGSPVRSKSVHFDELLPIKYFHKYESPTRVSKQNSDCEVIERINFDIVKPLSRYQSDSDSDSDSDSGSDRDDSSGTTYIKDDGLYDINFSILNQTSNNKDLKLNVFVNNKNNSNVMLQSVKLEKRKTYNNFFDYFIWGKISVKNLFYEKSIYIRYTFNRWRTFNEIKAQYVQDALLKSNFIDYDTFEFSLYNLKNLILNENNNTPVLAFSPDKSSNVIEGDLEFCIHYETKDPHGHKILDFWDNNNGKNYKIHLVLHTQDNNNKYSSKDGLTDLHSKKSEYRNNSQDTDHSNNNNNNNNNDDDNDDDEYFMFQTDKYYNIANELGGFNKRNNKFGKYKNSFIFNGNRKKTNSTFLDDLLDEKNFLQLDDYSSIGSTIPTGNFNNSSNKNNNNKSNILLLPKNNTHKIFGDSSDEDYDNDDRPLFFKDFRNPFAN